MAEEASLLSRWMSFGLKPTRGAFEHKKLLLGAGALAGIYMAHPFKNGFPHPVRYANEALLGDPHGGGEVETDIIGRNLNNMLMDSGLLSARSYDAAENNMYAPVNLGGQAQDMDEFLAQMVTYRNQNTLRQGPNGSLVMGLWNSRANYF